MTFGEVLADHMDETGLNQSDVAKIAGLTRAAISGIVNNKRDPMLSTALLIMRKTHMPIKYFMMIDHTA